MLFFCRFLKVHQFCTVNIHMVSLCFDFSLLAKSQYRVYKLRAYKARTSVNFELLALFSCGCCFCALSDEMTQWKTNGTQKTHINSKYKSCLWFIGCYCNFLLVRRAYSQFSMQIELQSFKFHRYFWFWHCWKQNSLFPVHLRFPWMFILRLHHCKRFKCHVHMYNGSLISAIIINQH